MIEKAKESLSKDIIKCQENYEICIENDYDEEAEYLKKEKERNEILLQYIEQLETEKQNLIDKLERDTVNITKTLQDGKHNDDYSRCRLKAYRTKTKEILSYMKGEEK